MEYKLQQLYGGAIESVIPGGLLDASNFRQVPDTQEVFVNNNNSLLQKEDNLIIDLLEPVQVGKGLPDSHAIVIHFEEISKLNEISNEWKLLGIQDTTQSLDKDLVNSNKGITSYLTAGLEPALKWGRSNPREDFLQPTLVLILGLIRLNDVLTDVTVSLNIPFIKEDELISLKEFYRCLELNNNDGNDANKSGIDLVTIKSDNSLKDSIAYKRIELGKEVVLKFIANFKIHDTSLFC
ncbi:Ran GTPase-binding protein MOG1 [Ascoidea rubescens DSM 1968]|uniref:Mog1p/PsbP-like protein n=1 Tax=Ascoidea rubescens DSM 1968 TaxID=1344418 RepID=A0A1D2VQT8_9ASCO|nr:Mog1p/PsbP-like protein [Ascoidea rubescens DSM 1968]ODV63948.1 Mog1p/PsbP-like protein [Ascoidea rubescens DSM 1968]